MRNDRNHLTIATKSVLKLINYFFVFTLTFYWLQMVNLYLKKCWTLIFKVRQRILNPEHPSFPYSTYSDKLTSYKLSCLPCDCSIFFVSNGWRDPKTAYTRQMKLTSPQCYHNLFSFIFWQNSLKWKHYNEHDDYKTLIMIICMCLYINKCVVETTTLNCLFYDFITTLKLKHIIIWGKVTCLVLLEWRPS